MINHIAVYMLVWIIGMHYRSIYIIYIATLVAQMAKICLQCRRLGFNSWVGNIPWRREWLPTPIFLPGIFQDRGSWRAIVHGVTKNCTQLSDWGCMHIHLSIYIHIYSIICLYTYAYSFFIFSMIKNFSINQTKVFFNLKVILKLYS